MQSDRDQATLEAGLAAMGLPVVAGQIDSLLRYRDLLLRWNQHFNLVSAGELPAFCSRHLLDSLGIAQDLGPATTILDVGSGAGLPGIPLAILYPDKHFILLDSNGKKTRFLFQASTELSLANVSVENCRLEHYQSPRQIDIVTCRAFASLAETLALGRHCFSGQTMLLALKGRYPEQEIKQLPPESQLVTSRRLSIPGNDSERHVIAVRIKPQTTTV